MAEAEFDAFTQSYRDQHQASVAFGGFELDYFAQYKADVAKKRCAKAGLIPARIMDFGSGMGNALKPLRTAFPAARIDCVDVSAESLSECRAQGVSNSFTQHYDGKNLPYEDGTFDLVFTACVFHHIPSSDHIMLLSEIRRCLAPHGKMILFEHNPLNPLTQLAVARCPFDEHAVLIHAGEMRRRLRAAGFSSADVRYRLFLPGFLSGLRGLENHMEWIMLGAQYYVDADL